MNNYTITVNGNVYDVTVEENGSAPASAAAPRRAAAPASILMLPAPDDAAGVAAGAATGVATLFGADAVLSADPFSSTVTSYTFPFTVIV